MAVERIYNGVEETNDRLMYFWRREGLGSRSVSFELAISDYLSLVPLCFGPVIMGWSLVMKGILERRAREV